MQKTRNWSCNRLISISQVANSKWMSRTAYVHRLDPSKPSHVDLTPSKQNRHGHDTHATSPVAVWDSYQKYQTMNNSAVDNDPDIIDFRRGLSDVQKSRIVPVATVSSEAIAAAATAFKHNGQNAEEEPRGLIDVPEPCTIYEHKEFNGKCIAP